MSTELAVAVLALVGTVISGIISSLITNSLTKYRLKILEEKVDKHNSIIERTYILEGKVAQLEKK